MQYLTFTEAIKKIEETRLIQLKQMLILEYTEIIKNVLFQHVTLYRRTLIFKFIYIFQEII